METKAPAFTQWLDDFFHSYYRHRPVNATFIGVHDYDDRLPDFSAGGVSEVVSEMKSFLRRLQDLPEESLTDFEAMDRKLAEGFLEIQLWEFESNHFHRGNPSLYTGEAIFGVMSLFLRPFGPFRDRMESAIARLAAIPEFLAQARRNVRRAPETWTQRAIRECIGGLHFLGEGIDILMEDEQVSESRLREEADRAAEALTELRHYLESELIRHSTDPYACGEKPLDLLIKKGHFLDMDAAAIERLALERLSECEATLESRAADFGASHWKEALSQLSDVHPTADGYYDRYQEVWDACRVKVGEAKLLTWPDYPIRYVPQPRWARKAAPYLYFLFYRSPAPYDEVPIVNYLVTPIEPKMPLEERARLLRANNDSVIKLNHVVHHGGPGHHVQNYKAYRTKSRIGRVAAADCASRIAMFCGGTMAEGWACYATDLMEEVGFLTPLEQLAEAHSRLRMAGRALVDVRFHCGELSLEQAAEAYRDRLGMSTEAAQSETVKNSMFPGTALMYLVGTELVHRCRGEIPSNETLLTFHDTFLEYGAVPVSFRRTKVVGR